MGKIAVRLAGLVVVLGALSGVANAQKGGADATPGKGSGSSTPNPDAIHDVVAQRFQSQSFCVGEHGKLPPEMKRDLDALVEGRELNWGADGFHVLLKAYFSNIFPDKVDQHDQKRTKEREPDPEAAYIFHVVRWKMETGAVKESKKDAKDSEKDKQAVLVSSSWRVYVLGNPGKLEQSGFKGNGDPLIYGKRRAIVVGIDVFEEEHGPTNPKDEALRTIYTTAASQGVPENQQDLGQLIAALLGVAKQGGAAAPSTALDGGKQKCVAIAVSAGVQEGTKKLPFDLKVTAATTSPKPPPPQPTPMPGGEPTTNPPAPADAKEAAPQNLSPGIVSCSGDGNSPPCAVTRTFISDDREWWDVSIGVTTPGVRESQFSINNNALQKGATRHTELYGLFDIFPAAAKLPKESWFPHVNVGIPVSSKSLYRPYFGMAENLTGWTHLQKNLNLPVGLNFFGGVVWMKTQVVAGNPTTAAQLTAATSTKRVWKGVFGIEVPVGSIASKIGGKGGSKNSNGSGGGGGKSGGN